MENGSKAFYVSARDGSRTALLLGPYTEHSEALESVERAKRYVQEHDPKGWFYAYGTLGTTPKEGRTLPGGKLNKILSDGGE
jgi:hypothetical protein